MYNCTGESYGTVCLVSIAAGADDSIRIFEENVAVPDALRFGSCVLIAGI
jgi:hypothetical protein